MTDTTHTEDTAEGQARAQYGSIVRMLAAVACDYYRLEELREERNAYRNDALGNLASPEVHRIAWGQDNPQDAEELEELEDAAGDWDDADEARERIQEDPLSVEVRSDWASPGETLEAGEFQILLCTGGPAVRIMGELSRGEPVRAWLEYQDWGASWTQYFGASSDTLCEYASHFFFGE